VLHCPVQITVLQDSSEVNHAKNTVRLLQLAIPTTQVVIINESTELTDAMLDDAVIIYPSDNATAVELWADQTSDKPAQLPKHIILLDGSWRKTHKIWMQYPQLHLIPALTFTQAGTTQYRIRKANKPNSMSTLEACAYTLEQLYDLDCSALHQLLNAMQGHWERFALPVAGN
jgi:DTW domain-containing protein YfiP